MKGLLIFKGRYGATLQYAIWAGAALQIEAVKAGLAREEHFAGVDYVVIGTSVYIGQLQISEWLKEHAAWLEGKRLVYFIVAGTPSHEKEKLEGYFNAGVPEPLRRNAVHFFLPGSLCFRQLSLKDKILLYTGSKLAKLRGEKINMQDYNDVRKEHLQPLLETVRAMAPGATVGG